METGQPRSKKLTTDQMTVLSMMEAGRGVRRTNNSRKLNRDNMFYLALDAPSDGLGLGWDKLSDFLRCEKQALHTYILGGDPKHLPWQVENRLNFLIEVVKLLRGSYKLKGVWHWFFRPRTQLNGKTPAQIFTAYWDPENTEPQKVLQLARYLSG